MFGDFEIGSTYIRREDIHGVYRGQQQGGIATPASHSVIFAFTGSSGTQHGYRDGWTDSGVFRYFGEGQEGDMRWKGGNNAIRDHAAEGEDLLLFQTIGRGRVRFMGQFVCAGYEWVSSPDRNKQKRNAIVFSLIPVEALEIEDATIIQDLPRDLKSLRRRAIAAATMGGGNKPSEAKRNCYARSAVIRAYVLARSNGVCECCNNDAPFATKVGLPYLEPHHIRRRSDGGPDHPAHVGAVCPNCHREAHFGARGDELNTRLADIIRLLEASFEQ